MVNHLLCCPIQLISPVDWLIHSLVHPIQLGAEAHPVRLLFVMGGRGEGGVSALTDSLCGEEGLSASQQLLSQTSCASSEGQQTCQASLRQLAIYPASPNLKELLFLNGLLFLPCILWKRCFVVVWGFRNRLLTQGWGLSCAAPSRGR